MEKLTILTWIIGTIVVAISSMTAFAFKDITFYEPFDSHWKGRWYVTNNNDYKGKWKYEKSQGHADYGLVVSEKAKKYGISYNLLHTIDPNEETLTLQYDVRFQKGIDCTGAYLKFLLPKDDESESNEIDNETPYSIMFGADKCGSTNKVHFIFRHRNPINHKFTEHHMKHTALVEKDRFTHVYTATIYPDTNTVKVFVDGVLAKNCNFITGDFEPTLVPPAMIPDPTDKKPFTWDERQQIPDPNATMPPDWDEDEPRRIVDTDVQKPPGWLDDEPKEIDDPNSKKPADWDDNEDGEWEQEKIENPKCEHVPGCGLWKPPMKNNPKYKGKWSAPMVDNPNYSGVWEAKQIPNPDYFEAKRPTFEKIGRIGIEIWSMDDSIIFDNILITNNESFAADIRTQTWSKKIKVEKQEEEDEDLSLKKILKKPSTIKKNLFEVFYKMLDWITNLIPFLKQYKYQLVIAIKTIEDNSILFIGFFGTIPILLVSIYSLTYAKKDISKLLRSKKNVHEEKKINSTFSDSLIHTTSSDVHQKPIGNSDQEGRSYGIEKNEEIEHTNMQ